MSGNRPATRLDRELVRRGLASSRGDAQELIDGGRVTVDGAPAGKAATLVGRGSALHVTDGGDRWASRGGGKLAGVLDELGVDPGGRSCLDAGASTGGFTDVLLARGARRVVAVDVGYGQLRWRLRTDPRVDVRDRTNVRHLRPEDVGDPAPDLVVADLSFISLTLVIPALAAVAAPGADLVLLVKPQFEAGRAAVDRGGVVRDPRAWRRTVDEVVAAGAQSGLAFAGAAVSPLPGPAGNIEFFVHLRRGDVEEPPGDAIDAAIDRGIELAGGASDSRAG